MPKYWNRINWPDIPDLTHLMERISDFPDYLNNQNGVENYSQAVNLMDWPTMQEDVGNIFHSEIPLKYVSLQRVLPPGLPWHTDRNRPFAAMAVIQGGAYTVFKEPEQLMQRVWFDFNKWYIFDGSIPHCVKGCKEPRLSICVNLSHIYKDYETACRELCN